MENIAESLLPLCVDIASVKTDKKNNRQHPERNLKALMTSLETYGQRKPIVVNADTKVIEAGNGLYLAAFKLGWSKIAAVIVKDDPNTAKGYAIMDNQSGMLSEWDLPNLGDLLKELEAAGFNMDLTGFSDDEIKKLTFTENEGLTDPDEIPEQVETVCKKGDLWQLGNHRLLCGDSTNPEDVKRLMNGEKADMVFTDPPYNIDYADNVKGRKIQNDDMGTSDYIEFLQSALTSCYEQASNSPVYVWFATAKSEMVLKAVSLSGWKVKNWIIWSKDCGSRNMTADYRWMFEPALYLIKDPKTLPPFYGDRSREGNVWDIPDPKSFAAETDTGGRSMNKAKYNLHPNMKPVAVSSRAISNSSQIKGIVLDLFGGSGSTLIACEKLNRRCYMMEIDEHYCDVIIQRWQNFTGKKAFKLNDKIQLPPSHRIKEAVK